MAATTSTPYWAALYFAGLPSLSDGRDKLCCDFFRKIRDPSSCIQHLLPDPRDPELTSSLFVILNAVIFSLRVILNAVIFSLRVTTLIKSEPETL